jgi:hypothetical protein
MIGYRARVVLAATAAAAVCATVLAGPAAASGPALTPGASAYAAGAGTGTAALQANLLINGTLGGILDSIISPIINDALNPLIAALQGSVNPAASAALGPASPLNASTDPNQPQATTAPGSFPVNDAISSCTPTPDRPCYAAAATTVNGAPLASIGLSRLSGYAEQVVNTVDATNPILGRSGAAGLGVSVLPNVTTLVPALPSATNPLVTASTVDAKANCPNDGAVGATKPATAPSALVSATGVSLLGGLVTFDVANGWPTNLVVNSVSYPDTVDSKGNTHPGLLSLSSTTVSGVTISRFGNALRLAIPVTFDQLLTGLGLPATVVSELTTLTPTSSLTLSLIVGPQVSVTNRTATAWGLGVGVDLAGSITFNLLNLVTAKVSIPTGIGGGNRGNILDLRLAFTTCGSGIKPTSNGNGVPPVPLGLV